MSHSLVHREKRRVRALDKAKEGRILRNAGGRRWFMAPIRQKLDLMVRTRSWWRRFKDWTGNILKRGQRGGKHG